MYVKSVSPELRASLRSQGFDRDQTEYILYNVKCGLTVKKAIEVLGYVPNCNNNISHKKISLYEQVGKEYKSLGKTDVSMLVCKDGIVKTTKTYVWFTLFGRVFRYRKQSDDSENFFL